MSELGFNLNPVFVVPVILLMTVPVFGLFLWLELKRAQPFKIFRIVALFVNLLAVLGLFLRPSFKSDFVSAFVLLTPGYSKPKVDSLVDGNPNLKILRVMGTEPYGNSKQLLSYHQLANENIKYIFGEGLPSFALALIPKGNLIFIPSTPEGIVELNLPPIFSNRTNVITGTFFSNTNVKLKMIGPLGVEDSLTIAPGRNSFSLSFTPKQPGLVSYELRSSNDHGLQHSELLPIEVKPERSIRILFLQNFPTVETRYLKTFLAERSHSVALRTQISKNHFSEEFVNMLPVRISTLTTDLLNTFDLIIVDNRTIAGLSKSEKYALERSTLNGLGILVEQNLSIKSEFFGMKSKPIKDDTVHVRLNNRVYVSPSVPVEVETSPSLVSVLQNKGRILSGYECVGAGKIGFLLLRETYRLALGGNNNDYATIWTPILENVSRKEFKKFEIKLYTHFPYYTDEPIDFTIVSAGETPAITSDEIKLPVAEDVVIDDMWHGKTWGGKPGWHRLELVDSTGANYFVNRTSEWRSLRASSSVNQTRLAISSRQSNGTTKEQRPVSLFLFYILFLLASTFLWLSPKI